MPRVVIELQANTQDAVNKIQQFARAQKDAFDAVKAGNPALQDAVVKVSKLSESTKTATQVTGEFNRATKSLAQGGIRELAGGIPIVGEALTALAGTLKGFPAILLGVVGAGAAFIAYLKSVEAQADKTAASIARVSEGIQAQTMAMAARVGGIRAGARGDQAGAAAGGFRATELEANAAKDAAIAAAGATRAGAISLTDRAMGLVNPQALFDKVKLADAAYQTARAEAEAAANEKITLARETLKATLIHIEEDLDKQSAESQAKRVKDAEDAAAKQQKLVEDLTASSLKTFQGLGHGFEDVVQSLELAQFVEKTRQQIAELNAGIEAGIDTHGRFAAGVKVLQENMAEALRLGYVPTIEKAEELATVIGLAADSAESAGERWLQSVSGISSALDEIIAKSRAAGQAAASVGAGGAASGGVTGAAPAAGSGGPVDVSGLIRTIDMIGGSFQHGGIVPGAGPIPIIAHGGEQILPVGSRSGGAGGVVRVEAGAIQISGTVIDQARDWDTLVDTLGQALAARLR